MSLNCLTCQGMKRTDSDVQMRESLCQEKPIYKFLASVERNWSGNLVPRPNSYDKMQTGTNLMAAAKRTKKGKNRIHNSAPAGFEETGTPRLVRSSGMRRDWSMEDLRRLKGY